ncbi:MAG TPA: ankyrin repeat domain-containing protein [Alphaproteobacteria bacterium]|nr:ankyrin repeat domain-containing protein [Alphaproteobacteria bacterium]
MPTDLCNIAPLRAEITTSVQMQLLAAVSTGCVKTAAQLVAAGLSVNMGDEDDDTPLTLAVARSNPDMVDFLLKAGADVNLPGVGGKSPLRVAIDTAAPLGVVKLLLAAGADPLAASYDDKQKKDVTDQMAADLAYINSRTGDENADTVLYEVTRASNVFNIIEIVKDGNPHKLDNWLKTSKVDINAYNRHGATALLHACQMGRSDLVELLWYAGADPSKPHKYDAAITPLKMAEESGNPHLMREIKRYISLAEEEFRKKSTTLQTDIPVMKPAQVKQRVFKG